MTDLEQTKAMLDRAGVVYRLKEHGHDPTSYYASFGRSFLRHWTRPKAAMPAGYCLSVQEGHGPRNLGYVRYRAEYYFAQDGSLSGVGAWE